MEINAFREEDEIRAKTEYKEAELYRVRRRFVSLRNDVLSEGITDRKEAELALLDKVEEDKWCGECTSIGLLVRTPTRIERYIEPYKVMIPSAGLPKKGGRLYVPQGIEHAKGIDRIGGLTDIKGGLARVTGITNDTIPIGPIKGRRYWTVFVDISSRDVFYSLDFLQHYQEKWGAEYGNQMAHLIINERKAKAIADAEHLADFNEGF